jgi:hypothetical protein
VAPLQGERPAQSCTIRIGAVNAEGLNRTVSVSPANALTVTCRCR